MRARVRACLRSATEISERAPSECELYSMSDLNLKRTSDMGRARKGAAGSTGFPPCTSARAVEVMRLGYLIAWDEERFEGREGAAPELADVWRGCVLPRAVAR